MITILKTYFFFFFFTRNTGSRHTLEFLLGRGGRIVRIHMVQIMKCNSTSILLPRIKLRVQGVSRRVEGSSRSSYSYWSKQKCHVRKESTALHWSGRKLGFQGFLDLVIEALWTVYSKEHGEASSKTLKASQTQTHLLCPKDWNGLPFLYLNFQICFSLLPFPSPHPLFCPCLSHCFYCE